MKSVFLIHFLLEFFLSFDYLNQKVRGVSIGGWLVLEPWITPNLFEQFVNKPDELTALDEYTFTKILGKEEASKQLKRHWETFVTEDHIARIAKSGINHIRIPVGYWIFGGLPNEPWVNGSFPFLLRAIDWAKKYNLKVLVDMHCAPGSQNGFDNSGRKGNADWFKNEGDIDRVKDIVVALSIIFNQPNYRDTVTSIELINEPAHWLIDLNRIKKFYIDTYNAIRQHNKNIIIVMHDAFRPLNEWKYLRDTPFENVMLDTHIYQVFTPEFNQMTKQQHLLQPCNRRNELKDINSKIWTVVGEFTLATDDCAKWLNGFNIGNRYEGTYLTNGPACQNCRCSDKTNINNIDNEFMKNFAMQQIAIYEQYGQGWFFWNFRADNARDWDYLYAVDKGWINLNQPQIARC